MDLFTTRVDETMTWRALFGCLYMEGLVRSGLISAVLDVSTTEIADEVVGRGLHSFPFPLNLTLLCPCPLNLSSLRPPYKPN